MTNTKGTITTKAVSRHVGHLSVRHSNWNGGHSRSELGRRVVIVMAVILCATEFVGVCVGANVFGYYSVSQTIGFMTAVVGFPLAMGGEQRARKWTAIVLLALVGFGCFRRLATEQHMSPLLAGLIAQDSIRFVSALVLLSPLVRRFVERRADQVRRDRRK